MNWREVQETDLAECLSIEPRVCGDEIVGRGCALTVWKQWARTKSFNSAVIEASTPHSPNQKIGFGSSVFVTPEFANQELQHPQPGLNSRVVASVSAGKSVVLPETNLSGIRNRDPLDLVILSCNYLYGVMTPEQTIQAEMILPVTFAQAHIGYRLNRILSETVCERQYRAHDSSGVWRTAAKYPDCGHALIVLTEKEAFATSGSVAAPLFQYREPVLHLRDTEKQLLAEAINGETDQELAARMNLSLPSIKKRWASLFDRIADTRPDLLPDADQRGWHESRGPQKRHRILAYVRSHPEELRPFRWHTPV
jgi:DNA-binding CsgD family transcriptional regulator